MWVFYLYCCLVLSDCDTWHYFHCDVFGNVYRGDECGYFTSTAVLFCQIVTCDTIFIVMCLVMYIGEMSVGILPLLLSCSVRL